MHSAALAPLCRESSACDHYRSAATLSSVGYQCVSVDIVITREQWLRSCGAECAFRTADRFEPWSGGQRIIDDHLDMRDCGGQQA